MNEVTVTRPEKGIERQSPTLEKELERCLRVLIEEYHPQEVWLFGSVAAGRTQRYSDIDLVVIKKTDKSFWDRLVEVFHLLNPKIPVDILVYTPSEWAEVRQRLFFQSEVLDKGKLLYEASN